MLSPDLTSNDKTLQQTTGGLTPDDAGPTYAAVLFAIAESPVQEGVIWTGSNDGLVHVTRDGGLTWTDVTSNIPNLPPTGTVSNVEPSRYEAGTAYLTVDLHQLGDTNPYVYRTTNFGDSWTSLSEGIPRSVFSYAHVIREDPVRPGLLYLGTENALYLSLDDGRSWSELQNNLPHAPVHDLTIQSDFNDLVVATYGRGFWIMDDVTPIQQLTEEVLESDVYLFAPRPALRFLNRQGSQSQPEDPGAGQNPDYGRVHLVLPPGDPHGRGTPGGPWGRPGSSSRRSPPGTYDPASTGSTGTFASALRTRPDCERNRRSTLT